MIKSFSSSLQDDFKSRGRTLGLFAGLNWSWCLDSAEIKLSENHGTELSELLTCSAGSELADRSL